MYVDGILVGTDNSYNSSINLTTVPVRISDIWYPFDGMIDNAFIYDRELDINEIQQYMNCLPTGNESGLVAYWDFEEGSGNTVYDQTSNGNDGAINGAAYNTNVPSQSCQFDDRQEPSGATLKWAECPASGLRAQALPAP